MLEQDYTETTDLRTIIKWYLDHNLTLVLLERHGKKPAFSTLESSTTTDLQRVIDHVTNGNNVGFIPGDDLVVLDIDRKNDVDGVQTLSKMGVSPPTTRVIATPNGGYHAYLALPPHTRLHQNNPELPGLEMITGHRKLVVIPGSKIMNGVLTDYTIMVDEPLAPCPPELLEAFKLDVTGVELDIERVSAAELERLVTDVRNLGRDYDRFLDVGMAIHFETQGKGYQLWVNWSKRFDGFDETDMPKKWHSFSTDRTRLVTAGTLRQMIRDQPLDFKALDLSGVVTPSVTEVSRSVTKVGESKPSQEGEYRPRLPGRLGEVEEWIYGNLRFDTPEMAMAGALHAVSALSGNRVVAGESHIGLNLYTILVMDSGRGKESVRQCVSNFIDQVMGEGEEGIILEAASSGSGLTALLSRMPNRLWMPDEFGLFLANSNDKGSTHQRTVIEQMMSAVANPRGKIHQKAYSKAKDCLPAVRFPFLSVMATTTHVTLYDALAGTRMVENGMLNRSVPIDANAGVRRRHVPGIRQVPPGILAWAGDLHAELPELVEHPTVIPIDQDADDYMWARCLEWDTRSALWARAWENCMKLAGIIALGDGMRITMDHVMLAQDIIERGYKTMATSLEDASGRDREYDDQSKKLLSVIRKLAAGKAWGNATDEELEAKAKGFVPRGLVLRRMKIPVKDFKQIEDTLKQSGAIICAEIATVDRQGKKRHKEIVGISSE